jgi:predicted RND superfamily exporter protein|tara:strand:- start:11 stop:2209 length:2199 start_codon:yes stop_codon:yes gene_type:complete
MLWQLLSLGFNYDFEAFFPRNNPDTEFFKKYRTDFETDNDNVLIGIENKAGVFQQDFLGKIDELTQRLDTLENVELVISPTNIVEYRRYSMYPALVERPYIHWNDSTKYAEDSAKVFRTQEFINTIFSTNSPSVAILIKHKELLDNEGCKKISEDIRKTVDEYDFDATHFAGRGEGQTIYINLVQNETLIFLGSGMFLVFLFLFIAYRSFWGIWMPLSVVGLVIAWTMGFMVLTGKEIDLMTNIVPTILMVIGISAVVHLLTHYLSLRKEGKNREEALIEAVKQIGFATLLTTLTTMIGFLTLLNSSVQPIVDLGIYASIGLLFSFLLTYTWFPVVVLLHKPIYSDRSAKFMDFWNSILTRIDHYVQNNYKMIVLISGVLVLVFGIASTNIKKNNYILEGLKSNHPQRQDFQFFENNFSGARPFEMKIWLKDSSASFFDRAVITDLEKLHNYLENDFGVGGLVSPISIVKNANKIWNSGKEDKYIIPLKDKRLAQLEKDLYRYSKQVKTNIYLKRNHQEARIVGNIPDAGSFMVNQKNEDLKTFYCSTLDTNMIQYRITGSATLMDINTNFVASNVIQGLLIAIGIIGIIVGLLFRSIKMALISLVPNVFPLVICGGIMGFFSIDFNLPTSIIFILAFGIAVDDSIHFLTRLKQELKKTDNNLSLAITKTFSSTGKAIIVTTLILSGGFLTLCLSDFLGTFYIGLLICITLLVALLCDLFLLPAIILLLWKK